MREGTYMDSKPIIIVGAGLAGLSAAIYLQKFGKEVLLLEASDQPGGRVATDNVDGFLCDRGFQLINTRYPELRALGVIEHIDFVPAPRIVDIAMQSSLVQLGDPRKSIASIFDGTSGSWREKLNFLKYLATPSQSDASVGYMMKKAGIGSLYTSVLKPFLTGVFFADPETVDAKVGRDLIQHFIMGSPSIPRSGSAALARALASHVNQIRYGVKVTSIKGLTLHTNAGEFQASAIIVATDSATAAELIPLDVQPHSHGSITWYHSTSQPPSTSSNLRIDGTGRSRILNSLVISNLVPEMAPAGSCLISTTTLLGVDEASVKSDLATLWRTSTQQWNLVARYDINYSLPAFAPGYVPPRQNRGNKIFIAGDYCTEPSQNGALLAGRLAAQELALN